MTGTEKPFSLSSDMTPLQLEPELFELLRGFYSLVPPSNVNFPAHLGLLNLHTFFLDAILSDPHFQQYPPSAQYQKNFWKRAIHLLERSTQNEARTMFPYP